MKQVFSYFILFVLLCAGYRAGAQGMAVNTTGAAANSSAMLDVSSTSKGILIPRMTGAQKWAISSPATGLMIYQTDTPGFSFYTGSTWAFLNAYTNVTTQGNTFNGSNQLVQTNSSSLVATSNLGTGTADSTKFLRGNNTWAAPITCGTIRTVTTNTTLLPSDQIVGTNATSTITLTLFSPNLVPKGYQLNLINLSGSNVFISIPSGVSVAICGDSHGGAPGLYAGPTIGFLVYSATIVGDGVNTWYAISWP